MANINAPTGFKPIRYRSGAPYNGACNRYYVQASDSTALGIGDPVIIDGSADAAGVASVTRATAGSAGRTTGVVVGFEPSPTFTTKYRPASTAAYVYVADDPDLLFEVQSSTIAAADIGNNADMASGTVSTTTGLSGFYLDTSTKGTTATLQWRIVGVSQRPSNDVGQYAKVLVRMNLPTETGAVGSTGV